MRAIPDARRAIAIVTGLGAVVAVVAMGIEVVAYEGTRARWRAVGEQVAAGGEGSGYDAATSDALYAQVRARRADARRDAWIAAALIVIAASSAGALGAAPRSRDEGGADGAAPAPARRVLAASATDVVLGGAGLGGAWALAASSPSIAAADTLAVVLPAAVLAIFVATTARGATPGLRAAGLALDPRPGPARAVLAAALLSLTAAWLALGGIPLLALALARPAAHPATFAPHLALVGLRATARSGALRAAASRER